MQASRCENAGGKAGRQVDGEVVGNFVAELLRNDEWHRAQLQVDLRREVNRPRRIILLGEEDRGCGQKQYE